MGTDIPITGQGLTTPGHTLLLLEMQSCGKTRFDNHLTWIAVILELATEMSNNPATCIRLPLLANAHSL